MKIQSRLLGAAAPVALSVALFSQPAFAQDQDDTTKAVTADELSNVEVETDEADAIVVTGSRIRRTEATSASPLQIIDPEISRKAGLNDTAAIIQNSPIASGSSQITSAISSNAVTNGGLGVQTISLRGLGSQRTLVLLNSRRAGPAGTRGAVSAFDLNVIPSSVIKSVEILKDGASSVYGSDAVAGVVNILTKTDTDGLQLDGFASLPTQSGGEEFSASAAWGKDFGRGHILLAGEYYRHNELERKDRKYLSCDYDYLFRTTDYDERVDLIDPRTSSPHCNGIAWGQVWAYYATNVPPVDTIPFTLMQYDYDGSLANYLSPPGPAVNPGDISAPPGWYPVGRRTPTSEGLVNAYSPYEQKASVYPKVERFTAYLDGSFQISDSIEAYAEGLFNRRTTYIDSTRQIYNFGYTGLFADDDPENPFPGWGSAPGSNALISPTGIIDQYDQDITVDYYRAVLGLRGDITKNISFDVYGQYSLSDGKYRLQQVLKDAIDQQSARGFGAPCAGEVTPISGKDCLQINWVDPQFMAGNLTQEEIDYLTDWETGHTKYTQKFVEASVSGDLFDPWGAGAIGFALGGVIRDDKINDTPGDITYAPDPDNPGEFVDNAFQNAFSSQITAGHQTTKELFGEVEIPIITNKPFFQNFTLSGAARVTNVKAVRSPDGASSSTNGNWTYKLTGNWQMVDWLRVRGTYGTSFRAPGLFEQFLAGQVSSARQNAIDPCVNSQFGFDNGVISQEVYNNCIADGIPTDHAGLGIQASVFTSGGLGVLKPETSRAWTASVILTPKIGPNTDIALTIDYFDIRVNGEIRALGAYDILYGCYSSNNFPNSPFCDMFERGQDGNPDNVKSVRTGYVNVDEQNNRGFDFTLRVRQNLGNAGTLSLVAEATLQTKDTILQLEDFNDLNGEVGDPKFTGDVRLVWDVNDWSFLYGVDFIGKSSSVSQFLEDNGTLCDISDENVTIHGGSYCYKPFTPAVFYHTVSVTKNIGDRFQLTAGVKNLFNTRPPQVSGVTTIGGASPFVSQYDWYGARFFMNAGLKF